MRIFIPLPRWSGRLAADLSAHFFDEVLRLSRLVEGVYVVAEGMEGERVFEVLGNVFVERVSLPHAPPYTSTNGEGLYGNCFFS